MIVAHRYDPQTRIVDDLPEMFEAMSDPGVTLVIWRNAFDPGVAPYLSSDLWKLAARATPKPAMPEFDIFFRQDSLSTLLNLFVTKGVRRWKHESMIWLSTFARTIDATMAALDTARVDGRFLITNSQTVHNQYYGDGKIDRYHADYTEWRLSCTPVGAPMRWIAWDSVAEVTEEMSSDYPIYVARPKGGARVLEVPKGSISLHRGGTLQAGSPHAVLPTNICWHAAPHLNVLHDAHRCHPTVNFGVNRLRVSALEKATSA